MEYWSVVAGCFGATIVRPWFTLQVISKCRSGFQTLPRAGLLSLILVVSALCFFQMM